MPLPTNASVLSASGWRVGEADQARRVGRALADADDAAVAALLERASRRAPRPSGRPAAPRSARRSRRSSAGHRSDGGVLTRSRTRVTDSASTVARSDGVLGARGAARARSARATGGLLLVAGAVAGEGVGAQQPAERPRPRPARRRRRAGRARRASGAGQGADRGARGAAQHLKVVGALLRRVAEADGDDQRRGRALRSRDLGDLAGLAGDTQGGEARREPAAEGLVGALGAGRRLRAVDCRSARPRRGRRCRRGGYRTSRGSRWSRSPMLALLCLRS